MNNKSAIILILIIILLGAGLYFFNSKSAGENMNNNAELMNNNSTVSVIGKNVEYFPNAQGYFVRPEEPGNYPGIVMIHENRGLRPEIRDTAETLAKEGYMVLAVDLYGGTVLETQEEARAFPGFDQETHIANMHAAADYLREHGAQKLASLGWCFGGRQSLELAMSGEELDATVVYYGGGMATTTDRLAPIAWPVLGIFGDEDRAIPVEMVEDFESSLNTLDIENEIYIYPGVGHAFANPSGTNYAPAETMDAWQKTLTFLSTHLK
jgi:carboxymethylenebutenolidase